jgi:hypothetical protein
MTGSGITLVPGANGSGTIANIRVAYAAAASVVLNASCVAGDVCDINCDGSVWYVSGFSSGATTGFA